jgi:hypothetical protein
MTRRRIKTTIVLKINEILAESDLFIVFPFREDLHDNDELEKKFIKKG